MPPFCRETPAVIRTSSATLLTPILLNTRARCTLIVFSWTPRFLLRNGFWRSAGVSHQPTEGRFAAALGYEDFTMAEINKLSVGQAIDKLRGKDAPKSEMEQLDQKIEELDEATQRLRSERHRIERDQRANQNKASLSRRVDEPDGPRGFFQNKASRLIFFGA